MNTGTNSTSSGGNNNNSLGHSSNHRSMLQRNFSDVLTPAGQLTAANPSSSTCVTLASAFLARGWYGSGSGKAPLHGLRQHIPLSDFIQCVTHASRKSLRFPHWNQDACKIGILHTCIYVYIRVYTCIYVYIRVYTCIYAYNSRSTYH